MSTGRRPLFVFALCALLAGCVSVNRKPLTPPTSDLEAKAIQSLPRLAPSGYPEEVARLQALKDRGSLNEAQFKRGRSQLLANLIFIRSELDQQPQLQTPPDRVRGTLRGFPPGYAVVDFVVNSNGHVAGARVIASNNPALGNAYRDEVRSRLYQPGLKDGRTVSVHLRLALSIDRGPAGQSQPPDEQLAD